MQNNSDYEIDEGDEIKDLEKRLKMLDGERKAVFEEKQTQMVAGKTALEAVKKENKELKDRLAKLHREGKGKSFQHREFDRLENKVHLCRKQVDTYKNEVIQLQTSIKLMQDKHTDLQLQCLPVLPDDSPVTQNIRVLENRLDKAMIKLNEALSIKRTYESILKKLTDERLGFDNQLQAIERTIKSKEHDFLELQKMSHDANYLREQAKADLSKVQHEFDEQRRTKEKELKEKKQYVQARLEMTAAVSKRELMKTKMEQELALEIESNENRATLVTNAFSHAVDSARYDVEVEKTSKLEEMWRKLKEVTGASDASEIIQKFFSSNDTSKNLSQASKEAQSKIEALNQKKMLLKTQLDDMKYSQAAGNASRRVTEEFEQQLLEAQAKCEKNRLQYERLSKLFTSAKAGIEHLFDMFKMVAPTDTIDEQADDEQVTMKYLQACVALGEKLFEDAKGKLPAAESATPIPEPPRTPATPASTMLETFSSTKKIQVTPHNVRVKLNSEDVEEEGSGEEEEGDVMDRSQVKKLATLAVEKHKKNKRTKAKKADTAGADEDTVDV